MQPGETESPGVAPSPAVDTVEAGKEKSIVDLEDGTESLKHATAIEVDLGEEGAGRIELMQQVWGKHGWWWVMAGIAVCMLVYELDNTTFGTYYVYAISDFKMTASSAALGAAADLTFSLFKPVWAKTSDVFGRGEMYPAALILIIVGLVTAASATNFNAFAAGTILRVIGITALNSMNTIVIADLTSTRNRGFGVNFQFWPYLFLPWISSYIVEKVVSDGGIGWHWGIGILAIILPFGVMVIGTILMVFQRRAKKLENAVVARPKVTLMAFFSSIDIIGLIILIVSLAFILLPLSLASLQANGYKTPWVIALIVVGGLLLLVGFPIYEQYFAAHPFFPLRYLKHRAIALAFLLYFTDYMAASVSHNYLYNWAVIAENMSIMAATNLSYINGVFTFFTGMLFGLVMWKTRQYKWWIMAGCVIRMIGYGVMFRIRHSDPTMGEIFFVQVLQGLGDGIVQTGGYVASTVNVPHRETAQMAALIVTIGMLGSAVGTAISGAIYTGTMQQELSNALGSLSTPELVSDLFNSITTGVPDWGTAERIAINQAYNNVTSYFYIAAMVIIAPGFLIVYFLPNQKLNDSQNLIEDHGMFGNKSVTNAVAVETHEEEK
ncbi:siderochrome-iron transporter [Xylariales sp. PMI_506]|nr:siderochrome-iron transporter [Xylariales sp. PMI_506]